MGAGSSHSELSNESDETFITNTISTPSLTAFPTALSNLYVACKNNQIEEVKHLLDTASLGDINRIEPHGSTALHAAAYYGHAEIVKLLLAKGAMRTIKNNYNYTPCEEAKTPEIKQLFARTPHTKRFGGLSGCIEWTVIDPTAAKSVSEYKETEKNWFTDVWACNDTLYLKEIKRYIYINFTNVDEIYYFIDNAIKENNILHTIKAYTAETNFYKALNIALASNNSVTYIEDEEKSRDEYFRYWHGPGGYAALIAHHPAFAKYSFTGISYRGMIMFDADIKTYKKDTFLINKAFLSTSIDRKTAKQFSKVDTSQSDNKQVTIKYPTICTYRIKNRSTAFNISSISEYPDENEVLIMPRTAFRVVSVKEKRSITRPVMILIELHECDPETYIDMARSINSADSYY